MFEYLYGYATTTSAQFVLLAIYRPGGQALSAAFLKTYLLCSSSCNIEQLSRRYLNVHVDQIDDPYTYYTVHHYIFVNCSSHLDIASTCISKLTRVDTMFDLVITGGDTEVSGVVTGGGVISDHVIVRFSLSLCVKHSRVDEQNNDYQ